MNTPSCHEKGKKRKAIPDMPNPPSPPPKLTGLTAQDDLAHNRNRVGPIAPWPRTNESFGQMIRKTRDEAAGAAGSDKMSATEMEARDMLKQAGYKLADSIRQYEEAAVALMACDFNRGLTVAQWAKGLRVKMQEMNLEGA